MFKRVSQCMPTVGILYFGLFNPFHYSPLPFYLPPPIFQQLSVHILVSSTFTDFTILLMLCHSLFLSLIPRVPWSSSTIINMIYILVYILSCLFLYICLSLSLSSMYEKKHVAFVILSLAYFT
jgi:hypothetical protein